MAAIVLIAQTAYVAPVGAAQPTPPGTPAVAAAPSSDPAPAASSTPTPTAAPAALPVPAVDAASGTFNIPDPALVVELVDERTATSQTFDMGDGVRVVEFASETIFYKPTGATTFEPIELSFEAAGDRARVGRSPVVVEAGSPTDPAGAVALRGADGFALGFIPLRDGAGRAPETGVRRTAPR